VSLTDAKYALTSDVLSALGSIAVQRENSPFVKPTNAKWAAIYYLPNQPMGETLGDKGQDKATGIMQVDLHYPAGIGDTAADTDAEAFRTAFKAGHGSLHSGQGYVVANVGRRQGRKEDNWFIVSVTIGWYALVPRS
jgi:hypothetical protein